jgi:hypothetical protein
MCFKVPILSRASRPTKKTVWIPYEPGTANRFLMFDLNTNSFAVVLRCEPVPASTATTTPGPWRTIVGRVHGSTKSPSEFWGPKPWFRFPGDGSAHHAGHRRPRNRLVDAFRLLEYCRFMRRMAFPLLSGQKRRDGCKKITGDSRAENLTSKGLQSL